MVSYLWELIAFLFTLVVFSFLFVFLHDKKKSSIPGLKPRTKSTGNLQDIKDAGSLHEFLVKLHKDFGAIAGFWLGEEYVVSTASPILWKDIQGVFDRPESLFQLFIPFLTKHSIEYANGEEGRKRHKLISSSFGYEAMKRYYEHFFSVTEDLVKELDSTAQEEHISLQEKFLSSMAVRIMMLCLLGPYFKNDSKIKEYKISFYACWREMEERLDEGITPEEGSQRDIQFKAHLATMRKIATEGIEERRNLKVPVDEKILTDVMLDSGYDEDVLYADILAALLGGIHTSGLLLTWSLYFMAKYPEIQEKVYQELNEVLGEETITPVVINQLVYTKQVLNETLRYAVIAPYNARVSEVDLKIGEHVVPRQTPIITALGVVHQDTEIWSEPERFNPDRFDPKEMKKKHPLTFEAFGIGKRKCPGYRFTYTEIIVVLSILLRRFKFHLVEGQQIGRIYGLISHPDKDIYVTVSQR